LAASTTLFQEALMHSQLSHIVAQHRIAELQGAAQRARAAAPASEARRKPRRRRRITVLSTRGRRLRARIAATDR
jgi:hypothetical protein